MSICRICFLLVPICQQLATLLLQHPALLNCVTIFSFFPKAAYEFSDLLFKIFILRLNYHLLGRQGDELTEPPAWEIQGLEEG